MIFATYPLDIDGPAVSVDPEGEVAVSAPDAAGPSVSVTPLRKGRLTSIACGLLDAAIASL